MSNVRVDPRALLLRASWSNALLCDASSSDLQAEVFLDVPGQGVVDLVVAGYRLLLAGCRVVVNVVASTMPQKSTALLLKLADQLGALHSAISFVL